MRLPQCWEFDHLQRVITIFHYLPLQEDKGWVLGSVWQNQSCKAGVGGVGGGEWLTS